MAVGGRSYEFFSFLTVTRNQRFVRLLIHYTNPVTGLEKNLDDPL